MLNLKTNRRAQDSWGTLPEPKPLPVPKHSGFAVTNGIEIYYAVYGEGPPVILLHGGIGSGNWWGNQIDCLLERKYQIILIDNRGNGRSTRSEEPYSYDLMMSDTLGVLDHLDIPQASFVGWSDGAIIALSLAARHRERVSRLFSFGANTTLTGIKSTFGTTNTFRMAAERAAIEYQRLSRTPEQYEAFLTQISELWSHSPGLTSKILRKIMAPTTIATAQYDEAIRLGHARHIARSIPDSKLIVLSNASHFAPLQKPAEFNFAMLETLNSSLR